MQRSLQAPLEASPARIVTAPTSSTGAPRRGSGLHSQAPAPAWSRSTPPAARGSGFLCFKKPLNLDKQHASLRFITTLRCKPCAAPKWFVIMIVGGVKTDQAMESMVPFGLGKCPFYIDHGKVQHTARSSPVCTTSSHLDYSKWSVFLRATDARAAG